MITGYDGKKLSAKNKAKQEIMTRLDDVALMFVEEHERYGSYDERPMTAAEREKVEKEIEKQVNRIAKFLGFDK